MFCSVTQSFLLTYLKHSLSSDSQSYCTLLSSLVSCLARWMAAPVRCCAHLFTAVPALRAVLCGSATFFTASTGLAAVNISGQTLHSFAGVGLGEGDASDLLRRVMVAQHARRRWQTCQILVIDEVSMIDRVLFDKLEYIARSIRKNPLPFGGIQLILTGDFLQLPPVKGRGFAFESRSWSECVPVVIELQSVFRQKNDSSLVGILNQFRRGVVDRAAAAAMQACINRSFDTSDGIEATELYAMKAQVSSENDERLAKLDTAEVEYAALDKGNATYLEQLTRSCNAVERLLLKEGAQVMLIKNLTSALVNGSRGVVVSFDVQDANEMQSEHRRVSPSGRWPRVKFTNGSEMTLLPERWDVEVSQKSVASRTQVPLMLAWSLTVHKCQGMTLDRVRLHLGSIFEYGQAYVALSRIRSLDSLSIKDKFPQHVIKAHPKALQFYDELHAQNGHSNNALPVSVPPPVHAAPTFASNTPADIPDPYGEQVGDGDMDISDELIAMAANDADETDSSSASQLLSSTFAERDSLLSPASFSSSAASPFVRASMLSAVSVSQPAAAPSRADGISQHLTVTTSLTSTASSALSTSSLSVSAETRAQPSITAATVRRHQLLLKKQTKATPTQTTLPPAASAPGSAVACTAVGEMASSPPAISGGTRTDEIDLVSDDEDSASPPPVSAVNQWSRRTAPTAEPNQQPVPITSPIAAIVSPHAPLPAPSSDSSVPSPSGRIPVAATLLACTARLAADDGRATKPLPPIVSSQCGAHNRPLQAHIDWNKENEPDVQTMKMDGEEGKKREQTGGVQWLYRCEMGCLLAVRLTT